MFSSRSITRVGYSSGNVVYDDQQVSVNSVKLPAVNAPDTTVLYNMGIAGGITFPSLGFAIGEHIYFDIQTPHSMKLNTVLDIHIHYVLPSALAGDLGKKIKFQVDVISGTINGAWATVAGTPFAKEFSVVSADNSSHRVIDLCDVPAVNNTVSTIYKCKLTRVVASANDYTSDVYLLGVDCHYQKDTIGSLQETSKQ